MDDPRRYLSKIAQGIADLTVPEVVQTGAKNTIEAGENVYISYMGTAMFRSASG